MSDKFLDHWFDWPVGCGNESVQSGFEPVCRRSGYNLIRKRVPLRYYSVGEEVFSGWVLWPHLYLFTID